MFWNLLQTITNHQCEESARWNCVHMKQWIETLYRVFSGLQGQCISVTYPRRKLPPTTWPERQGWITYCACPWHHLFTQRSRTGQPHGGYTFATWKSSDKLTKEKFCEYVRSASLVKEFLSQPGIKENAFDPLGEVFHCFDPKFYHKDDWEKKSIAGVLATFLHRYINDLL